MKIGISSVLSAFEPASIGTRVLDKGVFLEKLEPYIQNYDFTAGKAPGQGFIVLPLVGFYDLVSTGDGPVSSDPADYVVRKHRGEIGCYLRRERAGKLSFLAVVVYTAAAYAADPDVIAEGRFTEDEYVIVAVIASSGPAAPRTAHRFVENLAGGNNETLSKSAAELQTEAKEISAYWKDWSVVAD